MSATAAEYNAQVIDEFRGNKGRVGPDLAEHARRTDRDIPVIVLTPLGGA